MREMFGSVTKVEKQKEKGDFWPFVMITALIVLPIRIFIAQPFIVNGASRVPTFENGDYLIVDELSYRFREPARGEVVIFKYPKDTTKYFIKRIVGLPGETLSDYGVTLGPDEYFVLGDNKAASSDSRVWGPVRRDLIVGRPYFRLLPPKEIGILPGDESVRK